MDAIFLRALHDRPERGAEFFLTIAAALSGDEFAEFMSGNAGIGLWCKVLRALPPAPFVQSLLELLQPEAWKLGQA